MQNVSDTIKKINLHKKEVDYIILEVKHKFWPKLMGKPIPKHCGVCYLFNLCKVVDEDLICPWQVNNKE